MFIKYCDHILFQVVPYKECKQGLEPQEYSETVLTPKRFVEKECIQNKKEIPHKKLLPECKNVTKQNCVTNWETDSYGNQVKIIFKNLQVWQIYSLGNIIRDLL